MDRTDWIKSETRKMHLESSTGLMLEVLRAGNSFQAVTPNGMVVTVSNSGPSTLRLDINEMPGKYSEVEYPKAARVLASLALA